MLDSAVPAANVSDCMTATAVNGHAGLQRRRVGHRQRCHDHCDRCPASNGLIHVIDKVLMPTDTPRDIPATAGCTGVHDSLVAAVVQADLLTTLQGEGPFTLFAPTDQAFADAGIDLAALDTPDGVATLRTSSSLTWSLPRCRPPRSQTA